MAEWTFKESFTGAIRWQNLADWSTVLQKTASVLNQYVMYGSFSHNQDSQIQKPRRGNGGESIHYHSGLLGKILFPVPVTLISAGLEVLVPDRK